VVEGTENQTVREHFEPDQHIHIYNINNNYKLYMIGVQEKFQMILTKCQMVS